MHVHHFVGKGHKVSVCDNHCHRVGKILEVGRGDTCPNSLGIGVVECRFVKFVLLTQIECYSCILGEEQCVLAVCREESHHLGLLEDFNHTAETILTVKEEIAHCFTHECVAVRGVNIFAARRKSTDCKCCKKNAEEFEYAHI